LIAELGLGKDNRVDIESNQIYRIDSYLSVGHIDGYIFLGFR